VQQAVSIGFSGCCVGLRGIPKKKPAADSPLIYRLDGRPMAVPPTAYNPLISEPVAAD